MNLLRLGLSLPRLGLTVYSILKTVCLRCISMEWNLFLSDGQLKKMLQL